MQRLHARPLSAPQLSGRLAHTPRCPGLLAAAVVLLSSLPVLAAAPGPPRAATPPLPDGDSRDDPLPRLRQMWDRRASALSAIRYVLSGEVTHAAGSVVSPGDMGPDNDPPAFRPAGFRPEATTRPVSVEWLIDFENEYFRKESHDWSFNTISRAFRPFVRIEVSGGDGLRGYWPRKENTSPQYRPNPDKEVSTSHEDRTPPPVRIATHEPYAPPRQLPTSAPTGVSGHYLNHPQHYYDRTAYPNNHAGTPIPPPHNEPQSTVDTPRLPN